MSKKGNRGGKGATQIPSALSSSKQKKAGVIKSTRLWGGASGTLQLMRRNWGNFDEK